MSDSFPLYSDLTRPTWALDSWWQNAVQNMRAMGEQLTAPQEGQPAEAGSSSTSQKLWLRKIRLVVYGGLGDNIIASQAPLALNGSPVADSPFLTGQFGSVDLAAGAPSASVAAQAISAQPGGDPNGIDLSQMRIVFHVKKVTAAQPNFLYAKVYNLSKKTVESVKQYHRVQLAAGYQSLFGMIFDGTVVLYVTGKENPVDSYIEIFAGDADPQINAGAQILTFQPGTTRQQKVEQHLQAMGQAVGQIDLGPDGQQKSLRQSVFIGMGEDGIRDQTNATRSDYFTDDGKAYVISWGYSLKLGFRVVARLF